MRVLSVRAERDCEIQQESLPLSKKMRNEPAGKSTFLLKVVGFKMFLLLFESNTVLLLCVVALATQRRPS